MFHVLANVKWLTFFFASSLFFGTQKKRLLCMRESDSILECHEFAVRVLLSVSFRQRSNNLFPPACLFHWCLCFWLLVVPLFLLFVRKRRTRMANESYFVPKCISVFYCIVIYFVGLIANTAVDLTFDWNQFEKKQKAGRGGEKIDAR